jgi:hypothetical protein
MKCIGWAFGQGGRGVFTGSAAQPAAFLPWGYGSGGEAPNPVAVGGQAIDHSRSPASTAAVTVFPEGASGQSQELS